jgi:hypothetical protein
MNEISITGGAKIGWMRATPPFAILTVGKDLLEINADIAGNLLFRPSDIVSIQSGGLLQLGRSMFQGPTIQIIHNVNNYPADVVFRATTRSVDLIESIKKAGFFYNNNPIPTDVEDRIHLFQSQGRFPIKLFPVIAVIVIWNILCLYHIGDFLNAHAQPNPTAFLPALGFMLSVCLLTLFVAPFRGLVLKPGRNLKHIQKFLYFVMAISALMLVMMTITSQLISK